MAQEPSNALQKFPGSRFMFCVVGRDELVLLSVTEWAVEEGRETRLAAALKAKVSGMCVVGAGLVVSVYEVEATLETRFLVEGSVAVLLRTKLLCFGPQPGAIMTAVVTEVASDALTLSTGFCNSVVVETAHWGRSRFAGNRADAVGLVFETRGTEYWVLKGDRVRVRVVETVVRERSLRVSCSIDGACLGPLAWYHDR